MIARPDTWMPVYWGDYSRDTGHLNASGHGAYLMLIKHYWCTGAPLNDNDDELWRIACCDSKREWQKLRPMLSRFFHNDSGKLRHKRIDHELASAVARTEAKARAGHEGAKKRWQKDSTAMADPSVCQSHNDAQSQSHTQSSKDDSSLRSLHDKPKTERGSRLPQEWSLSDEGWKYAASLGLLGPQIENEAAKFCDYWHAKAGASAVKRDWSAAWKYWIRTAKERQGNGSGYHTAGRSGSGPRGPSPAFAAAHRLITGE